MSDPFPDSPTFRVFSCPHCGCTMNTTQSRCPYCATAVDPETAQTAAAALSVLDQAVSDASYIRIVAITILTAVPTGFGWLAQMHVTPLLFMYSSRVLRGAPGMLYAAGLVMALGICGVFGMCLRWWLRFAGLESLDADFLVVRRRVIFSSVGAALLVSVMIAITLALRSGT
jgi:hypothetical protein